MVLLMYEEGDTRRLLQWDAHMSSENHNVRCERAVFKSIVIRKKLYD